MWDVSTSLFWHGGTTPTCMLCGWRTTGNRNAGSGKINWCALRPWKNGWYQKCRHATCYLYSALQKGNSIVYTTYVIIYKYQTNKSYVEKATSNFNCSFNDLPESFCRSPLQQRCNPTKTSDHVGLRSHRTCSYHTYTWHIKPKTQQKRWVHHPEKRWKCWNNIRVGCSLICVLFFPMVFYSNRKICVFPFEVCYYVTSHIPYDSPPFVYLNHELPGEIGEICCNLLLPIIFLTNHIYIYIYVFKHIFWDLTKTTPSCQFSYIWWRNFHLPHTEAALIPTNP